MMETQSDTNYSNTIRRNIIALDFGNSRVKMLIQNKYLNYDYNDPWIEQIVKKIRDMKNEYPDVIFYSSVNEEQSEEFIAYNNKHDRYEVKNIEFMIRSTNRINTSFVKGIGADRLLGLIGGKIYNHPPFITIDCGTAITVNVIDRASVVKGGGIFPGLYTMARSLFDYTSSLELVTFNNQYEIQIGKNSTDSIKSGILASVVGGLKELITTFERDIFNGNELPILFTGGYAKIVYDLMKNWRDDIQPYKNLVLDGIASLADEPTKRERKRDAHDEAHKEPVKVVEVKKEIPKTVQPEVKNPVVPAPVEQTPAQQEFSSPGKRFRRTKEMMAEAKAGFRSVRPIITETKPQFTAPAPKVEVTPAPKNEVTAAPNKRARRTREQIIADNAAKLLAGPKKRGRKPKNASVSKVKVKATQKKRVRRTYEQIEADKAAALLAGPKKRGRKPQSASDNNNEVKRIIKTRAQIEAEKMAILLEGAKLRGLMRQGIISPPSKPATDEQSVISPPSKPIIDEQGMVHRRVRRTVEQIEADKAAALLAGPKKRGRKSQSASAPKVEITPAPNKRVRRTREQIEADNAAKLLAGPKKRGRQKKVVETLAPPKRIRRTREQIEADNAAKLLAGPKKRGRQKKSVVAYALPSDNAKSAQNRKDGISNEPRELTYKEIAIARLKERQRQKLEEKRLMLAEASAEAALEAETMSNDIVEEQFTSPVVEEKVIRPIESDELPNASNYPIDVDETPVKRKAGRPKRIV